MIVKKQTTKGASHAHITLIAQQSQRRIHQFQKKRGAGAWFVYTLLAIILPFSSSKTSGLVRALESVFGFTGISQKRYDTFMASTKIPWDGLWERLWTLIPEPVTNGRLIMVLDDYINPKTGKIIFGCSKVFDHAAKQNQSEYPWRRILWPLACSR